MYRCFRPIPYIIITFYYVPFLCVCVLEICVSTDGIFLFVQFFVVFFSFLDKLLSTFFSLLFFLSVLNVMVYCQVARLKQCIESMCWVPGPGYVVMSSCVLLRVYFLGEIGGRVEVEVVVFLLPVVILSCLPFFKVAFSSSN